MKPRQLILLLLFLTLEVVIAQQTNSVSDVVTADTVAALKALAEKGDAHWQYVLGESYALGIGVTQDNAEAAKWFYKAAEQGDVEAQFHIGTAYRDGNGLSQDQATAVTWFRKAAEQGDCDSQVRLADAYEYGDGIPQDYSEAAKWFQRAAQQGNLYAQSKIGTFRAEGTGVSKDNVEAYKWFNLAAARNADNEPDRKIIERCRNLRDLMIKVGEITPVGVVEAQRLSSAFVPRKEIQNSDSNLGSAVMADSPRVSATGFFITDNGYLISNYHVVKDAAKVHLLTGTG